MTATMPRANGRSGRPLDAAAQPSFLSARLNGWWLQRLHPAPRPAPASERRRAARRRGRP